MKKIINVVEDEKDLNELVKSYLEKDGHLVNSYLTYDGAFEHIDDYCDLWILDIMLDDKSGYDLIEEIKVRNQDVPVIFMSARDKEFDRIIGLEKGSDDYITKPFSPKELVLRVNNILKRVYKDDNKIEINGYLIDENQRIVLKDNKQIELTTKEFDLLMLFVKNKGTAFLREQILEKVWDDNFYGSDRVVDDTLRRLRKKLPEMNINDTLIKESIESIQKFTQPPYRYTEARLIKKMEELGIGRPSTYALTMETLRARAYVTMDKKAFVPTEQGILTSDQLQAFFKSIINVKYTANMENNLDLIAEGKTVWYQEIQKFYDEFVVLIDNARDNMVKVYPKKTDEFCPECGCPLVIRRGPFGEFTACSDYPSCKYIKKKPKIEPVKTGIKCPNCGEGELVERINIRGRNKGAKFYACDRFPTCKTTYSGLPNGEKCSVCGAAMIIVNGNIRCGNEYCKTVVELKKKGSNK